MKHVFKLLVVGLIGAFLLSGCAKAPVQEQNDSKAAVEAATNADTQTYAKDALSKLQSDLDAANAEVKTQDAKFLFKNFDNAKKMLTDVKAEAEAVKAEAAKKKEEAKQAAITAQADAKKAIDDATALLAQAPTGKETKQDIEAFKADLTGLTDSLAGIQQSIDAEKYADASSNAAAIKEKAANVASQITAALEKVKAKKGGKKAKK
jgi:hypothetical protein